MLSSENSGPDRKKVSKRCFLPDYSAQKVAANTLFPVKFPYRAKFYLHCFRNTVKIISLFMKKLR
jgi:hypothetical protein